MKKPKLKDFFEGVAGWTKIFLLFFMMTLGFVFAYMCIWIWLGWPQTVWAMCVICAAAGLTEYGYYRWIDG